MRAASLLGLTLLLAIGEGVEAQGTSTFQASRQAQTEEELRAEVSFGAGTIRVSPLESSHLYRLLVRFDEGVVEPEHSYSDGLLRVGARTIASRRILRRTDGETSVELGLGQTVPTHLKLELGAVQGRLDLGGIPLRSLDLSTGASDTELRVAVPNPIEMSSARIQVGAAAFLASNLGHLRAAEIRVEAGVGDVRLDMGGLLRDDTRVHVSMGLGNVEIRVPRGVGVRLDRSTFLTAVNAPDLVRRGSEYVSPEWDDADRLLRIRLDAAIGNVSITRYDP